MKTIKSSVPIAFFAAALVALAAAGCGTNDDGNGKHDGWGDVTPDSLPPDYVPPDVPPTDGTTDTPSDVFTGPSGTVRGVVYSPQGWVPEIPNFPVSGALIYIALPAYPPDPIPEGAVCNLCVTIDETVPHAFSAADGTFEFSAPQGAWLLVVQKGEFRKLAYIDVVADTMNEIDRSMTTFPRVNAPPNDTTPKMAIALGSYDIMEDIVAKMGLCGLNSEYHWDGMPCDHIDMFCNKDSYFDSCDSTPFANLLQDLAWMKEYDVIFVPCSDSTTDDMLSNPTVLSNIRQYVNDGGKWYIADWSYDWVEQAFPEFIDFEGEDTVIGDADMSSGEFDTTGHSTDADLSNWLLAIGDPATNIDFIENWDCIQSLGTVPGFDEEGNPISITPYTWAAGPVTRSNSCIAGDAPLTITFPYGCGKVLFTTYHTVGAMGGESRANLMTQEKILFYLILEIGLCTEEVIVI